MVYKNELEERVKAIEERNKKVEQDKAWETSWTRRLTIAALTYVTLALYLLAIDNDKPFTNAIVPTIGFVLSTLVLKTVKNIWQKND